jgi:hypothetical protein
MERTKRYKGAYRHSITITGDAELSKQIEKTAAEVKTLSTLLKEILRPNFNATAIVFDANSCTLSIETTRGGASDCLVNINVGYSKNVKKQDVVRFDW